MKVKILYLYIFLFIFFPKGLLAQISDSTKIIREIFGKEQIIDIQDERHSVVIGAARTTRTADKLPVTVYIINQDEIIFRNAQTLVDVLKMVPGVRVSSPHSGEFGQAFLQRGMMGNNYSKILLNGIDIKPTGVTGMTLGANLPILNAERIEIVYGPASASYGNDACGGVINIVTKQAVEKNFTQVDLSLGTGAYSNFNFATAGKFGRGNNVVQFTLYGNRQSAQNLDIHSDKNLFDRWNYLEMVLNQSGNGFMVGSGDNKRDLSISELENYLTTGKVDMMTLMQIKPALYAYSINYNSKDLVNPIIEDIPQYASQMGVELKYRAFAFTYNYLSRKDHSSLGLTPMLYSYENSGAFFGEQINRWTLSADFQFGRVSSNTMVSYLRYRMDPNSYKWGNWSTMAQYVYGASDDLLIEENINFKFLKNFEFSSGVSYKYSGVLPNTLENPKQFDQNAYSAFAKDVDFEYDMFGKFGINPTTFSTYGMYAQLDWDVKKFTFTGGVRFDNNSLWGSSLNPRIAALYQINDKFSLRISRGYAYKSPTLNQMYYCHTTAVDNPLKQTRVLAYHHIANKDLKPEEIVSNEFGIRSYFKNLNYVELVVYTNKINNPLIRSWIYFDRELYQSEFGVVDGTAENPDMTRSYKNLNSSFTKLLGIELIGVLQDIYKPIHLNLEGALTISNGKEKVQDEFSRGEDGNPIPNKFVEVNSIRQVPRYQAQLSVGMNFFKQKLWVRAENTYCSSWARKYYLSGEGSYDKEPAYYNLDLVLGYKIGDKIRLNVQCINLTDSEYGGIDAKEMDIDLPYNIQLRRSFRFGISYAF